MRDRIDQTDSPQPEDARATRGTRRTLGLTVIAVLIGVAVVALGISGVLSGAGRSASAAHDAALHTPTVESTVTASATASTSPTATATRTATPTASATSTPSRTEPPHPSETPAVILTATSYVRRTATAQARITAAAIAESTEESQVRRTATAEARASAAAIPVEAVAFVTDVSIPDHSELAPGEAFEKTWRVRNVGSEAWPEADCLRFVSGARLDAAQGDFIPAAEIGDEVDITVPMVAPEEPGEYSGTWCVVDGNGERVGDQLLTVVIDVVAPTATPTPAIDFVVVKQDVLPVFVDGGCNWQHNIYVTVIDKYGNPLDGLVIGDTYNNIELVSGTKGPGRCDFDLWKNTLELYIKRDEAGTPYRSEVSRRLSSDHPEFGDMINGGVCKEEAECQDKLDRFSYCWGHYSYELVFQRTW